MPRTVRTHLIKYEVQYSRFAPAAEHIVVRLGGAVADQEVALALHDLLGPLAWQCAVVPGVRTQLPGVQTQLPLERLLQGDGLLLLAGTGLGGGQRSGGIAAPIALHPAVFDGPMGTVALGARPQFLVAVNGETNE